MQDFHTQIDFRLQSHVEQTVSYELCPYFILGQTLHVFDSVRKRLIHAKNDDRYAWVFLISENCKSKVSLKHVDLF